jgi:aconitate hydratase
MSFIASPEIVTAFALAGRLSFNPLTDAFVGADGTPFRLDPPRLAPEVPARGYCGRGEAYVAPPEDGTSVSLVVRPDSERLHLLHPWPAWDGRDFLDLPVLVKTRGRTTTDQISPAGRWLRYRGHLDRFSDNLFEGAVNAFTGETGRGQSVLGGAGRASFAAIARGYRDRGLRWVAVGDWNYGEGSSREHAALSPRWLGAAAVIAKSFARIHETNLKKQGLLALTFEDPADYDRIREDDRLSLVGLHALAEGQVLEARLAHADGTAEEIGLRHSYRGHELAWFRAGSALNAGRAAPAVA